MNFLFLEVWVVLQAVPPHLAKLLERKAASDGGGEEEERGGQAGADRAPPPPPPRLGLPGQKCGSGLPSCPENTPLSQKPSLQGRGAVEMAL